MFFDGKLHVKLLNKIISVIRVNFLINYCAELKVTLEITKMCIKKNYSTSIKFVTYKIQEERKKNSIL